MSDKLKQQVAEAALDFIEHGMILGVGTGSTVDYFIEQLAKVKAKLEGAVASSKRSAEKLKQIGIPLLDLNSTGDIALYIDGADEINAQKQMIKGGGGAMTGEKIVASAAKHFICIVDESKCVDRLGDFPIAVEVLPMARSFVGRHIVQLGGSPEYRYNQKTDHDNLLLDVYNLDLTDPLNMEQQLNQIPGAIGNGIFASRTADIALVATKSGIEQR